MKEMEYIWGPGVPMRAEILDSGTYRGYEYCIISHYTHPCAYVVINTIADYPDNINEIDVHGGFTFDGQQPHFDNKWCIGWDYAHYPDYMSFYEIPGTPEYLRKGHRWTTAEILNEVHSVIDQIIEQLSTPPSPEASGRYK